MLTFPPTPAVGDLFPDPVVAGTAQWRWDGVKWVRVGSTLIPPTPQDTSVVPVGGVLRLIGGSPSTTIGFFVFNGGWQRIAGQDYALPAGGITAVNNNASINGVAGQTLAANTLYYVYLFANAGVLTLDFSTTGHATSATAGNVGTEIKQGDDSRTLLGIVRTGANGQFYNDAANRLVRSWFNRGLTGFSFFGDAPVVSGVPTATATFVSLVSFANETLNIAISGIWFASVQTNVVVGYMIDGVHINNNYQMSLQPAQNVNGGFGDTTVVTEGFHVVAVDTYVDGAFSGSLGGATISGVY